MTSVSEDLKSLAGYFNVRSYIKAFKDGAKVVEWPIAKMRLEDTIALAQVQNDLLNDNKKANPAFFYQNAMDQIQARLEPIASIDIESEEGKAVTLSELDQHTATTQSFKTAILSLSKERREQKCHFHRLDAA